MAKSTGKAAAYQRLKPLQGDVTTDILNAEDQEFKHRAEQRIIDDRNAAKKAAENAARKKKGEDYATALGKVQLNKSSIKSHDERIMDLYFGKGKILDRFNEYYDRVDKDPYDKDAIAGLNNIERIVDNVNLLTKSIVAKKNDLDAGLESGLYSKNLNKGLFEKLNGTIEDINYELDLDDNQQLIVKTPKYDKNGDGVIDELDTLTLEEALDPKQLIGEKRWDAETWATSAKKNYGKVTNETNHGKEFGFDFSKLDNLYSEIDRIMGSSKDNITSEGKSLIADWNNVENWENVSEDQFKSYKANLAQRLIDSYETGKANKTDYRGLEYGLKKQKYEDGKNKDDSQSEDIVTLNVKTDGTPVKATIKEGGKRRDNIYSFIFDPKYKKPIQIGEDIVKIEEFFYDEKTGKITYSGIEQVYDKETEGYVDGKTTGGGLNDTQLSLAISKTGLDAEEFKNELLRVKKERLNESSSNTSNKKEIKGF